MTHECTVVITWQWWRLMKRLSICTSFSVVRPMISRPSRSGTSCTVRRHYLNDGDVVLVGKHELIYVDERSGRQRGGFTDNLAALAAQPAETPAEEEDEAAEEADDQGLEATGPG